VRGVLAPLLAFHLLAGLSFPVLGWIAVGLILISISFLLPEIKFGKRARQAAVLVEEVSD